MIVELFLNNLNLTVLMRIPISSGSDVVCIKLNEINDLIYVDLNLFSDVKIDILGLRS